MNINSSISTSYNNVNLIAQNSHRRAEAFGIVKHQKGKESSSVIKRNHKLIELLLTAKHIFFGGGKSYQQKLHTLIESNVEALTHESQNAYIKNDLSYTELFLAAQRYNHAVNMSQEPSLKKEVPLFENLSLKKPIIPKHCPETAPVIIHANKIVQTKLENIPADQEPYIHQEGLRKHKLYHYNKADTKIDHGKEAARIFFSTQIERLLSLIGRIIETVAKIFNKEISFFNKYHYFKNGKNNKAEIYADDAPLSQKDQASSYWIGHATCLFNIPVQSNEGKSIPVNIITDPVEGDLNKLLYPRMTKPARSIETCPTPHIYLLSHNHLDHYDKQTIKKLRKTQPVMLVPEGDAKKFQKLGFKNVYETNWWQTTTIPIEHQGQKGEIKITAVPSRHWSGQGPCSGHHAAFVGYVIHQEKGDIYFAGDTARLSEAHIKTLRERFNIQSMFQPGGPDEMRKDMESTHQASVDGLWMHFNLMLRNLYDREFYSLKTKEKFIQEAKKLQTIYMHTKTFKLGNLHFDDTEESVARVKESLRTGIISSGMKTYEKLVYQELLAIGQTFIFKDGSQLKAKDVLDLLDESIIIPKIGSRTELTAHL